MKKLKKYLKDAMEEISSAEKYINIAYKMKEKQPNIAKEYKDWLNRNYIIKMLLKRP